MEQSKEQEKKVEVNHFKVTNILLEVMSSGHAAIVFEIEDGSRFVLMQADKFGYTMPLRVMQISGAFKRNEEK